MNYLVLYAKLVDDKDIGMLMTGIYIGGVVDTENDAEDLARKCVTCTQGGTAIARIRKINGGQLMPAVEAMTKIFDKLAERMYENERTVSKKPLDHF